MSVGPSQLSKLEINVASDEIGESELEASAPKLREANLNPSLGTYNRSISTAVEVGRADVVEFPSSKTSVASSDADLDDAKSTGSSHPFSSPNRSEYEEHFNLSATSETTPTASGELAKRPYKRRKQLELMYTNNASARLAYPLSERQQMAMLMQMTAADQQSDQPKSPGSAATPTLGGSSKVRGKLAKVHRRNDRGETALHIAAKRGDNQICLELLREGAEVNVADYAGWSPLHEACNKGWYETAEILIKNGANPNACGLGNDTPLHDAALNGNKKLVILLLRHGADPLKANDKGKRPLDVSEDKEITDLLKNGVAASAEAKNTSTFVEKPKADFFGVDVQSCQSSPSSTLSPNVSTKGFSPKTQFSPKIQTEQDDSFKKCLRSPPPSSSFVRNLREEDERTTLNSNQSSPAASSNNLPQSNDVVAKQSEEMRDASASDDEEPKTLCIVETKSPSCPKFVASTCSVDSENEARLVVVEDEETDKEEKTPTLACVSSVDVAQLFAIQSTVEHSRPTPPSTLAICTTPKLERPKRRIVPPSRTSYANASAAAPFVMKKFDGRGRKRKVEKDVYEFHSSDSDVEPASSLNESPLASNRRKLLRLTETMKNVAIAGESAAELVESMSSVDFPIENKTQESKMQVTHSTPSLLRRDFEVTDISKHRSSMAGEERTFAESSFKHAESSLKHFSNKTPTDVDVAMIQPAAANEDRPSPAPVFVRGRSGSQGLSPNSATVPPSKKERLLGFRRRRGSHVVRFGREGNQLEDSELTSLRRMQIDSIVGSVLSGGVGMEADKVDDSRSNSNLDSNDGIDDGAPKVPPLKLVLSNVPRQVTAAEEDANRTYVVRSRASSFDRREDQEDANGSRGSSDDAKRNTANSSSPNVAGGEGGASSQRVTRSQARLHGSNNDLARQIEEAQGVPLHPRKRKIKPKLIEPVAASRYYKPVLSMNLASLASKNSFEAHNELRKAIEQKWKEARQESRCVDYTRPTGYSQFLLHKKTYLRKTDSKCLPNDVENVVIPEDLPAELGELFKSQQKQRDEMKIRHRVERERLILACETEALRVHNRITRGTADPAMSAMRVLRDADIYNPLQLDTPIPFSFAALSENRFAETCSMDDVLIRFSRSKRQMVGRQRLESDCLCATQFCEWGISAKVCVTETATSPAVEQFRDRCRFPSVEIVQDFELLPQQF